MEQPPGERLICPCGGSGKLSTGQDCPWHDLYDEDPPAHRIGPSPRSGKTAAQESLRLRFDEGERPPLRERLGM